MKGRMMASGSKGMGMRKHGKSGFKNGMGRSPKARYMAKMEAEKNEVKAKPSTCIYESVSDLFKK